VPASYPRRICGFLIDVVVPVAVWLVLVVAAFRLHRPGLTPLVGGIGLIALLAFALWNSCYRQGVIGQSLGKVVAGTRLVGVATGEPVGFARALGRGFARLLDAVPLFLGFLWPLFDEQRQTFADKVCATLVVRARPRATPVVSGAGRPSRAA
jgi:uncharacterized RDD family membrane protein YckC